MTAALVGGEWSAAGPSRTLPPGKTRYPFHRRLGGPQGRSGRAENLVPTGIRSRIVQPVVSRYTDWATGPTGQRNIYLYQINNVKLFTSWDLWWSQRSSQMIYTHYVQNINSYELVPGWLSHGCNITTLHFFCFSVLCIENFNISVIPLRAMHAYFSMLGLYPSYLEKKNKK